MVWMNRLRRYLGQTCNLIPVTFSTLFVLRCHNNQSPATFSLDFVPRIRSGFSYNNIFFAGCPINEIFLEERPHVGHESLAFLRR